MKKILAILAVCMLLAGFSACSKGGDSSSGKNALGITDGGSSDIGSGTLIERQGRMMDQMIGILEGAGNDAGKAANGLVAYQLKNAAAIKKMQVDAESFKQDMQKDPSKAMGMLKDAQALMEKATKLAGLMEKFQKDPKFMDALGKLQLN